MEEKDIYQLICDDETLYLKLTEVQATFVEEICNFIEQNSNSDISFKEFKMPKACLEIDDYNY